MSTSKLPFNIVSTFTSRLPAQPQTQKPSTGQSAVAAIRAGLGR